MLFQFSRLSYRVLILCVFLSLSACNLQLSSNNTEPVPVLRTDVVVPTGQAPQATTTHGQPQVSTALPVEQPTAISETAVLEPYPPATAKSTPGKLETDVPVLAFLKDGDIWLIDEPEGQAYPLTVAGDITSFAWASGGERLAAFNGKTLCFIHRDGSVRTACLDLGLNKDQAKIERRLILSPDQQWIVLWNPVNPQDEGAIGWMIVALDTTNIMYRIEDPTDWGASLFPENEPGGFTGQPEFLSDGSLVGTLSHRALCGPAGCHYQLFQFNLEKKTFTPYPNKPEEGFSEGARLFLSPDKKNLSNFGVFFTDCDNYITFVDTFDLSSQARITYNLDKEVLVDLAFKPGMDQAIIARTSGCSDPDQTTWATACGLFQGFEILPMQLWTLSTKERLDLLPGVMPVWSPDGEWAAFRSCLVKGASGAWQPDENAPAGIYLINLSSGNTNFISEGTLPQWRPKP